MICSTTSWMRISPTGGLLINPWHPQGLFVNKPEITGAPPTHGEKQMVLRLEMNSKLLEMDRENAPVASLFSTVMDVLLLPAVELAAHVELQACKFP
jgi:hypothetical protein